MQFLQWLLLAVGLREDPKHSLREQSCCKICHSLLPPMDMKSIMLHCNIHLHLPNLRSPFFNCTFKQSLSPVYFLCHRALYEVAQFYSWFFTKFIWWTLCKSFFSISTMNIFRMLRPPYTSCLVLIVFLSVMWATVAYLVHLWDYTG